MISIRKGMWETNSSTLHQFTICTDDIVQDEPSQPLVAFTVIDEVVKDEEFKSRDAEDRFNIIMMYAISDMIDSIACGIDVGENWTVPVLDKPQKYLNEFNNTLEWLYNLQKAVEPYVVFEKRMTKDQWKDYAYYIREKYNCCDLRLVGTDMFTEFSKSPDQIMKWPLDNVVKFIVNDDSYYYQIDHGDWDPDNMPNNKHFRTIYMEE